MRLLDRRPLPLILAALTLLLGGRPQAQEESASAASFPPSTPLAEGVSPDAVDALDALVQELVDDGEIVGAELLVLKDDRAILHEAYGLADQEAGTPMERDRVFCVRSMTKPLIGVSIHMLADEKRIKLSDKAGKYLPSFADGRLGEITLEELLTHTSGLPMSLLLSEDLAELHAQGGITAVADLASDEDLGSEPGAKFNYSDQGTDTLTAIVEVVTGAPAEDFVRTRILEPLGMRNTRCVFAEDDPLRARALPAYAGRRGAWTRFWGPDEPPLFPFFLGSQGLYSTVSDYARFLALVRDRGRADLGRGERLLKMGSVRKTLRPETEASVGQAGFPGVEARYGRLMQLWLSADGEDGDAGELVAFGHTGSDGTYAWAFPEANAMVLFFTQSRANRVGARVEEAVARVFLGAEFDPNVLAPPFEDYLGYYREHEEDGYRAIVRDGADLSLEVPGKAVVPLAFIGEDRWKIVPEPTTVLAFDRDASGAVVGYHIGDHVEHRFTPSPELPTVAELQARVNAAHGIARLAEVGPIRMTGTVAIPQLGVEGAFVTTLAWPDRFRSDSEVMGQREESAFDGEVARSRLGDAAVRVEAEGSARTIRLGSSLSRYGDWSHWYGEMSVVQRLTRAREDGEVQEVFLVREGGLDGPGRTLFVHESGRVLREHLIADSSAVGRLAQRLAFDDHRDVSGLWLPHRIGLEIAGSPAGEIVLTVDEVELGVEVSDELFRLED